MPREAGQRLLGAMMRELASPGPTDPGPA
jgi:hypothetical protein